MGVPLKFLVNYVEGSALGLKDSVLPGPCNAGDYLGTFSIVRRSHESHAPLPLYYNFGPHSDLSKSMIC